MSLAWFRNLLQGFVSLLDEHFAHPLRQADELRFGCAMQQDQFLLGDCCAYGSVRRFEHDLWAAAWKSASG